MNYSDIKNAVSSWLHREDLTANAATFVILAEERLRDLRLNRNTASTTLTITAGNSSVALPSDYLEGRSVSGGGNDWQQCSPEQLETLRDTGWDSYSYAIYGGNLVIPYIASSDVELALVYYQALPALSDVDPTNWITDAYPGVYIWLALSEAALYVGNEAKRQVFEQRAGQALEMLRQQDTRGATFAALMPSSYVV